MARSEARIFTSIWSDQGFRSLPPSAQHQYFHLLSQPDLSYCGLISLRERRWSRDSAGTTIDQVRANLELLAGDWHPQHGQPLIVIDEETEEVLVRSLIRHDGIWKQPNLMKSALAAAADIKSRRIRAVLLEELRRIPAQESESRLVRSIHAEFIALLEKALANPSGNPSPKGSANPSGFGETPGQEDAANPSEKGSANPSQGEGVTTGSTTSVPLTPGPPPPVEGSATAPKFRPSPNLEGEEDQDSTSNTSDTEPRDDLEPLEQLTNEVRSIRPEWSARSIRRALTRPSVLERPAGSIRAAILAVARDRESQSPGRLEHDGPWWRPTITGTAPYDQPPPPLGPRDPETAHRGAAAVRAALPRRASQ